MKIVLRDDVENLGHKGDVVDVADGYARNYLVPRGLAMKATKGVVAQAESMRRNRAAKEARDVEAAQTQAAALEGARIEISARAGEGGKLFGSVTATDVADAIQAQRGIEVDRRRVGLDEPLKELSEVEVEVTDGRVTVRDHGPGFPPADLDKVFDRFWRSDEARGKPGSGLGLAIVQRVAEEHGGSVRAENAEDGGAVVTLELPALALTEPELSQPAL